MLHVYLEGRSSDTRRIGPDGADAKVFSHLQRWHVTEAGRSDPVDITKAKARIIQRATCGERDVLERAEMGNATAVGFGGANDRHAELSSHGRGRRNA